MRVVVKVGTSTLAHKSGCIDIRHIEQLCKVISDLKNAGHEMVLVSSGAIGMGVGKLALNERPSDMQTKQAVAAVGQCELMYAYDKLFSEYNHTVAQVLVTGQDMEDEQRHNNITNTVNRLLQLKVLPVINENDTVATEEISIGDNDTLGALVAVSVKADLLVMLSDIDGMYTADPYADKDAKLIKIVDVINSDILAASGDKHSGLGTGGMNTKLRAAGICMKNGTDTVIANGSNPAVLYDILEGKQIGTRFVSKKK